MLLYVWLSSDVARLFTKGGMLVIIGTAAAVWFIPKFFLNIIITKQRSCSTCGHEENA